MRACALAAADCWWWRGGWCCTAVVRRTPTPTYRFTSKQAGAAASTIFLAGKLNNKITRAGDA